MSTNHIAKWAALLLTFSGMAAMSASAASKVVNGVAAPPESNQTYEAVSGTSALYVYNPGASYSGTNITLSATFNTGNNGCYGAFANNQASLTLTGGTVTTTGIYGYAMNFSATSTGTLNNITIITNGIGGRGISVSDNSALTFTGGTITTTGTNAIGVNLTGNSSVTLNNVAIETQTQGYSGHGVCLVGSGTASLDNVRISTAGDTGVGFYMTGDGNATAVLNNVQITTTGTDMAAYGIRVIGAGDKSVEIRNSSVTTQGPNTAAIFFSPSTGTTTQARAVIDNSAITSEHGYGMSFGNDSDRVKVWSSMPDFANTFGTYDVTISNGSAIRSEAGHDVIHLNTLYSGTLTNGDTTVYTGTINLLVNLHVDNAEIAGNINVATSATANIDFKNNAALNGNLKTDGQAEANIDLDHSTITGTITASDESTLTVTLNNSTLTGKSTISDSGTINLSLTNGAVWNLTGSSSVTTLSNSGTIIIANALGEDLGVSDAFTQGADGTLDLNLSGSGPIVNAGTASLGGTLKVSGFSGTAATKASEIVAKNFTVIHSASGISGDFSTVDFGGAASTVDYVTLLAGKSNNDLDYALYYGLSWFAPSSTSHGNFTIASGNTFEIDIVLSDTAVGQGAGGWDGKSLTKFGEGTLLVSSSNAFTGGATVESGTLRLSNLAGAGSGTVNVAQTILSVLDLSGSGTYKNNTTGAGTIILSGSGVNISGNNSTFTGAWDVTGSGTMTSQNNLGVSGSTAVNIASGGALSLILGNGDYHFDQPLTGSGFLLIQNTGNISLVPSVPLVAYVPAFTGTVALERNTLALTADNALPLSNATLVTGTNNLVVVDSDPSATARNLGALSFSGGTIRFEGYDPHATCADTIIALTGTLSLSGGGTVEVVMPNPSQIPDGSKFTHIPLLQQDDGFALTLLISASNGVAGSPATLALRDTNGRVISDSYTLNLSHDGVTTDAIGTYDYLLSTSAANDGLYVAFGLKQVDIQAGRTLTLDQDVTVPAEGDDFTATLIGSGNLQINATNAITLNGTGNRYSGTTIVNTGTLMVGINEQMFASSTAFVIHSGAALNTGGFDQLVNNLSGSGLVTFTNNTLTVNNSASTIFTGTLNGSVLVKDGTGQLNASDAVAHLSQVQMDNGSLLLGANATVSASGQPAVLANGGTATFNASALSTSGSVLILAKDNSPATVNLNNMTISVVRNFVEANNGALTVTLNDSTATGRTAVSNGGALNLGLNNSVWNMTGKSKLTTLTSSGGTITIDNVQGEDLTVSSGITGQTALNLTLSDSVKGNQEIWVVVDETNNMTGQRFTLGHEVSYGMYNYNLVNNSDGAWLVYTGSSGTTPPINPPPINPPTISNEGDTIINTAAAVAGFWFTQLDSLHKRMGELRYNKPATDDALDNIWVRAYGQQINANTGIYSVKGFAETQYGVDLGTDYLWKLDAANQLYTGVFAGYGGADRDFHTNYSGNTDSGYGGLYSTWLNNSGWYADVVAKGQYFCNDFSGADKADYDSVGVGFSVGLGRQFEFKDGWFVEPSTQFSYLHLMNDNYTTRDNLHVNLTDADVLHIYGGARFGRNIKLTNSGQLQPYIKAGGLGQISSGNKLTVSGDHWRPNLDGARAVVGAGLIWQLNADSQLHLDYEASFGEKYDKPWGVNFGYRYQF